jgi:hypothetical protein
MKTPTEKTDSIQEGLGKQEKRISFMVKFDRNTIKKVKAFWSKLFLKGGQVI